MFQENPLLRGGPSPSYRWRRRGVSRQRLFVKVGAGSPCLFLGIPLKTLFINDFGLVLLNRSNFDDFLYGKAEIFKN